MTDKKQHDLPAILAPRAYSTDEETRLAAAINDLGGKMLHYTNVACRRREAPGEAKRQCALMKTNLQAAANNAMDAIAHSIQNRKEPRP